VLLLLQLVLTLSAPLLALASPAMRVTVSPASMWMSVLRHRATLTRLAPIFQELIRASAIPVLLVVVTRISAQTSTSALLVDSLATARPLAQTVSVPLPVPATLGIMAAARCAQM